MILSILFFSATSVFFINAGNAEREVKEIHTQLLKNKSTVKKDYSYRYKPASEKERLQIVADIWNIKADKKHIQALRVLK